MLDTCAKAEAKFFAGLVTTPHRTTAESTLARSVTWAGMRASAACERHCRGAGAHRERLQERHAPRGLLLRGSSICARRVRVVLRNIIWSPLHQSSGSGTPQVAATSFRAVDGKQSRYSHCHQIMPQAH